MSFWIYGDLDFGADALNALSQCVVNIIFFVLFVSGFAASFLGAFEIMLLILGPIKWTVKRDRGGIIGILFMALALAIVPSPAPDW
jgi:thiol:disulfide interchange protein DsbD